MKMQHCLQTCVLHLTQYPWPDDPRHILGGFWHQFEMVEEHSDLESKKPLDLDRQDFIDIKSAADALLNEPLFWKATEAISLAGQLGED
jgi:hypothetical protein